jgi:hypothetical protein
MRARFSYLAANIERARLSMGTTRFHFARSCPINRFTFSRHFMDLVRLKGT